MSENGTRETERERERQRGREGETGRETDRERVEGLVETQTVTVGCLSDGRRDRQCPQLVE